MPLLREWWNLEVTLAGRSVRTGRAYLDVLSNVLGYAVDLEEIETNPVPVKTAMGLLGMIEPQVRLPLCEMAEANRERLIQALRTYGLLRGTRGKSAGAGSQRQRKPRSSNAGRRGTRPKVLVGS